MKKPWTLLFLLSVSILLTDAVADQTIFSKNLIQRRPEVDDILSHHSQFSKSTSQHRENPNLETLGFVTPWNNRGYDIVKWFKKFTYEYPVLWVIVVWFLLCGTIFVVWALHGWIDEVRSQDDQGEIVGRILPRFAVEGWDRDAYAELISNVDAEKELIKIIVEQVTKYEFDGVVFEVAVPQYLGSFLSLLADTVHALPGEKRLVVVIPPYLEGYPSSEVLFSPTVHVDYFCLMTYDHNIAAQSGAPNAPIEWVEDQITHFIGDKPLEARRKLLVGLNMYGAIFTPSRRPIIGKEYIELLKKYKPSLTWDSESEESFWEYSDENGEGEVWYPTLKRLSLVEDFEVGGVALWELGQGLDYFYELF